VSQIAFLHPWVILLGSFLSTCGAGLQSLTGKPERTRHKAITDKLRHLSDFMLYSGRLHFLTSLSLSQFAERKFGLSTYLSQKVK